MSRRDYRIAKFGSWEQSLALDARMKEVGATEGIVFDFDGMERTPNTLDCHRLIWLGDGQGVQDAVVEALFRVYFTEGRDLSNQQTLLDVVAGAGLSGDRAEAMLNSNEGLEEVRAAEERARPECYSRGHDCILVLQDGRRRSHPEHHEHRQLGDRQCHCF